MERPAFKRVAAGHYEYGPYLLHRLPGVYPPAWNIEDTRDYSLVVDGAASKRDALALFAASPVFKP